MVKNVIAFGLIFSVLLFSGCAAPRSAQRDLVNWTFWGHGERIVEPDGSLRLSEIAPSKGTMLISPETIGPDCIVRYDIKALTEHTVLVTLLSLTDPGASTALTPPEEYDGSIQWIMNETEGYFIAFCNRPHNRKPFIRKLPYDSDVGELIEASENHMVAGTWYAIEVGRQGSRLYMKLDGKTLIETTDSESLGAGRIGLRIRGTQSGVAECQIRDLQIIR